MSQSSNGNGNGGSDSKRKKKNAKHFAEERISLAERQNDGSPNLKRPSPDNQNIIQMWPQGSTIVARELHDFDPTALSVMSRTSEISTCIIDKGAPGVRIMRVAGSTIDNESIAQMIIDYDERTKLTNFLMRAGGPLMTSVLRALSPGSDSTSGVIHVGTVLYNSQMIADQMTKELNRQHYEGDRATAAAILAEFISRALASTGTILKSMPILDLQQRVRRFPTYPELVEGIMEYEITNVLNTVEFKYEELAKTKKFKLELLGRLIERDLHRLAVSLRIVDRIPLQVKDSIRLVRMYLLDSAMLSEYPIDVRTNADLISLASNFTIVRAAIALKNDDIYLDSRDFQVDKILHDTTDWIRSGPRFEIRSLRDMSAFFSHSVATDKHSKLMVAVAHANLAYTGSLQSYHFTETTSAEGSQLYHPKRLPATEALLEQGFTPATRLVTGERIANFMMSTISMSQMINQIKRPQVVTVLMTDDDMAYYAASLADRIYLAESQNDFGASDLTVVYEKQWTSKNYQPVYNIAGAIVTATDPAELLFLADEHTGTEMIPVRNQVIPDAFKDDFLLPVNPANFMSRLTADFTYKNLKIGGKIIDVKLTLMKLLNQLSSLQIYTMVSGIDASLWQAQFEAYSSIVSMLDWLDVPEPERINYDLQNAQDAVVNNFMFLVSQIINTPTMRRIIQGVMQQIRLDHAMDQSMEFLSAFYSKAMQAEVSTMITVMTLSRIGYGDWPYIERFCRFLADNRAYTRYVTMIGV